MTNGYLFLFIYVISCVMMKMVFDLKGANRRNLLTVTPVINTFFLALIIIGYFLQLFFVFIIATINHTKKY